MRAVVSPERNTWYQIRSRCLNPRHKKYARYGGRGIRVCRRWLKSFEAFYADMGPRPGPGFSLERKDNDGHYCKRNCVWATAEQQANNRRTTKLIQFAGERLSSPQWARRIGIPASTLFGRLSKGVPLELAMTSSKMNTRWMLHYEEQQG
jgi:hypothetical protein